MTEQNSFENTFDTIVQNIELFNNSKSKIQIFFKEFMDSKYISLKKIFDFKYVILGLLIYGINFCCRMYMANRHNYAINKHKKILFLHL